MKKIVFKSKSVPIKAVSSFKNQCKTKKKLFQLLSLPVRFSGIQCIQVEIVKIHPHHYTVTQSLPSRVVNRDRVENYFYSCKSSYGDPALWSSFI